MHRQRQQRAGRDGRQRPDPLPDAKFRHRSWGRGRAPASARAAARKKHQAGAEADGQQRAQGLRLQIIADKRRIEFHG